MIPYKLPLLLLATALTISAAPQAVPSHADLDLRHDNTHSNTYSSNIMLPSPPSTVTFHKRDRTYDDIRCGCDIEFTQGIMESATERFFKAVTENPWLMEVEPAHNLSVIDSAHQMYIFAINYTPEKINFDVGEFVKALDKIKEACQGQVPSTAGLYNQEAADSSGYAIGFMAKAEYDMYDWDGSIWGSTLTSCPQRPVAGVMT